MSPNKSKVKAKILKRYIICVLRRAHMLKIHTFQVTIIKKQVKELRDSQKVRSLAHFQYYNIQTFPELRLRSGWFVENRNWAYIWSTVQIHKRCPADIQTTAHGYATGCRVTAQPPVLMANNILPPHSSNCSFIPARNISTRVSNMLSFKYFKRIF